MLAPPLVGLFYVAVAEPSSRRIGKAVAQQILAALQDPLSLFSQRSPGRRVAGQLLSTKNKTGPQERVLSTVREREPPPVPDNPVPNTVAAIPIIPPQYEALPTDRTIGSLPFVPPAPFIPPTFIPGGFSTPTPPQIITPGPNPPESNPPGPNPPGPNPPGPNPPGPNPPGPNPPGPPPPDTPPVIPIPEPSPWTLMPMGLLVLVAARRARKTARRG